MDTVAVVTGANSGLGFQIARSLARDGARVVMACRSLDKAEQARRELLSELPDAQLSILQLDISEPKSIQDFGRSFAEQFGRLELLMNNAGILAMPLARNSVGHELQLATNYLGAFALTGTLLPFFTQDAAARIVNVGSLAHRFGEVPVDDLNWDKGPYRQWFAYARSKLALLSFTFELERRLRKQCGNIRALSAHPGFASTRIHYNSAAMKPSNAFTAWLYEKLATFVPSAAAATRPILHAATANDAQGGDYYGPSGVFEIAGKGIGRARIHPRAKDAELAKQLWHLSESMTGIRYLSDL
jgi:NAD(P)-dependent dehydrogenase (short-subunit alcohol dehydrogenase family)